MPYRRKDSPVWWVSFTGPDGKRIRRSTGTTDRREAEAIEAKWKLEAFKAKQWDEKPGLSFEALVLEYLKAAADKRSAKRDRLSARILRGMFAGVDMATLQGSDIRAYIAKRKTEGVSNATINRELSFLSSAINFARRDLGYDLPNPVAGRKLREPEGRVRWISRAEAEALIRAAETEPKAPHLADFIRLALHTGMRRGEILGLLQCGWKPHPGHQAQLCDRLSAGRDRGFRDPRSQTHLCRLACECRCVVDRGQGFAGSFHRENDRAVCPSCPGKRREAVTRLEGMSRFGHATKKPDQKDPATRCSNWWAM